MKASKNKVTCFCTKQSQLVSQSIGIEISAQKREIEHDVAKQQQKSNQFKEEKFCMKYYCLLYSFFYDMMIQHANFENGNLFRIHTQKECMCKKRIPFILCITFTYVVHFHIVCLFFLLLVRIGIDPKTFG